MAARDDALDVYLVARGLFPHACPRARCDSARAVEVDGIGDEAIAAR